MSFIWNDKTVATIGELFDAAVAAMRTGQATEFKEAYLATSEHAASNLGYVIGYADDNTRRDLYLAYGVTHPVFGGTP